MVIWCCCSDHLAIFPSTIVGIVSIRQKLLDGLTPNMVEEWGTSLGRANPILVQIRIRGRIQEFFFHEHWAIGHCLCFQAGTFKRLVSMSLWNLLPSDGIQEGLSVLGGGLCSTECPCFLWLCLWCGAMFELLHGFISVLQISEERLIRVLKETQNQHEQEMDKMLSRSCSSTSHGIGETFLLYSFEIQY